MMDKLIFDIGLWVVTGIIAAIIVAIFSNSDE